MMHALNTGWAFLERASTSDADSVDQRIPREGLEQGGVGAASQFEVALRALEDLIFPNLLQVIG